MLKLCGFPISNYYNKVKIALLEKGVPFEEEHCLVSQEPALLQRSPMGKVPFLDLGNGQTLTESQVILEYLEDAYPDKPLYPRDPLARARCRELIAHLELHIELQARRLYRAAFFGGTVSDETKEQVKAELDKGVRSFMNDHRKVLALGGGRRVQRGRLRRGRAPAARVARHQDHLRVGYPRRPRRRREDLPQDGRRALLDQQNQRRPEGVSRGAGEKVAQRTHRLDEEGWCLSVPECRAQGKAWREHINPGMYQYRYYNRLLGRFSRRYQ